MKIALFEIILITFFLDLSQAEVYISYTNNSGTYVQKSPSQYNTQNDITVSGGSDVKTNEKEVHIRTSHNKSSIIDVPIIISTLNINNHSRSKSIRNKQNTGYSFQGSECVSCGSNGKSPGKPSGKPPAKPPTQPSPGTGIPSPPAGVPSTPDIKPWSPPPPSGLPGAPKPDAPTDDETNCCYISQERVCSEENKTHTCRTKVVRACGDRCNNPGNGEEAYLINDLEGVEEDENNFMPVSRPKKKPTHPYARIPFHSRNYPGRTYSLSNTRHAHGRRYGNHARRYGANYPRNRGYHNLEEVAYYRNPAHVPYVNYPQQRSRPSFPRDPGHQGFRRPSFHYSEIPRSYPRPHPVY